MGYLAAGAASGMGKEWLKQSDEKRANNYQMIRDKRLHGMRKENIGYEAELKSAEAKRHEGFLSTEAKTLAAAREKETDADRTALGERNDANIAGAQARQDTEVFDTSDGSQSGRMVKQPDGSMKYEMLAERTKTFSTNAATSKWNQEKIERRGVGGESAGPGTRGELYDEWIGRAYVDQYIDPENKFLGTEKVRQPDVLGWIDYHNATVTDEYKLEVNDPKYMQGDPASLFKHMQENVTNLNEADALDRLKKTYSWWNGPKGNTGLDNPGVPSPVPSGPNPQAGAGDPGYLEQGTQATAEAAASNAQSAVTSQNAGVGAGGPGSSQGSDEISVQSGATFSVNTGEIQKLESMLKNPNWNTKDRQRMEKRLAELKADKAAME